MGLAAFIKLIVEVVWWVILRLVDVICACLMLGSFIAVWRIPWIIKGWGKLGHMNDFRVESAANFFLSIGDYITLIWLWAPLTHRFKNFYRDWEWENGRDGFGYYNWKWRWMYWKEGVLCFVDLITFVMAVCIHVIAPWRIPSFWVDMNQARIAISDYEVWYDVRYYKVINRHFWHSICDWFVALLLIYVHLAPWRLPRLWHELKLRRREELKAYWFNINYYEVIGIQAAQTFGDHCMIIPTLVSHVAVWRIPPMWTEFKKKYRAEKKKTVWADPAKTRSVAQETPWYLVEYREIILENFAHSLVDIFLIPMGIPILLTVYRAKICWREYNNYGTKTANPTNTTNPNTTNLTNAIRNNVPGGNSNNISYNTDNNNENIKNTSDTSNTSNDPEDIQLHNDNTTTDNTTSSTTNNNNNFNNNQSYNNSYTAYNDSIKKQNHDHRMDSIMKKLMVPKHFFLLLYDLPFGLMVVWIVITLWRLPAFIPRIKAAGTADKRRQVICMEALFVWRDYACFIPFFCLLVPSLFRFYKTISKTLRGIKPAADPHPVLTINRMIPEPEKGDNLVGNCPLIHIQGTKPVDLTFKQATLHVPDTEENKQFWSTVASVKGSGIAWVAKKVLPLKMCPNNIKSADFVAGSDTFDTQLKIPIGRELFHESLHSLQHRNPTVTLVLQYGHAEGTLARMRFSITDYYQAASAGATLPTEMAAVPEGEASKAAAHLCDVFWKVVLEQTVKFLVDIVALVLFLTMHLVPHRCVWMYSRLFGSTASKEKRKKTDVINSARRCLSLYRRYFKECEYICEIYARRGHKPQRCRYWSDNYGSDLVLTKHHDRVQEYFEKLADIKKKLRSVDQKDLAASVGHMQFLMIKCMSARLACQRGFFAHYSLKFPPDYKGFPQPINHGSQFGLLTMYQKAQGTPEDYQQYIVDPSWIGAGRVKRSTAQDEEEEEEESPGTASIRKRRRSRDSNSSTSPPLPLQDSSLSSTKLDARMEDQIGSVGSTDWNYGTVTGISSPKLKRVSSSTDDDTRTPLTPANNTSFTKADSHTFEPDLFMDEPEDEEEYSVETDYNIARNQIMTELNQEELNFTTLANTVTNTKVPFGCTCPNKKEAGGVIFGATAQFGIDVVTCFCMLIICIFFYRLPYTIKQLTKPYNGGKRRSIVFGQIKEIGWDFVSLMEILVIIVMLKYSLALPTIVFASIRRKGWSEDIREVIHDLFRASLDDFWWLLAKFCTCAFFKYFVSTSVWGFFSPAIVFNPIFSERVAKSINVLLLLIITALFYVLPPVVVFGLNVDSVGIGVYVVLGFLGLCGVVGIAMALASKESSGIISTRMQYISMTDWSNMITIVSLLVQLCYLMTLGISTISAYVESNGGNSSTGGGGSGTFEDILTSIFNKYLWLGYSNGQHTGGVGWGVYMSYCIILLHYLVGSLPLVVVYVLEKGEDRFMSFQWQPWIVIATLISETSFGFVLVNMCSVLICDGHNNSGNLVVWSDVQCWVRDAQHTQYRFAMAALLGLAYYLPTCMVKDLMYIKCQRKFFAIQFNTSYWAIQVFLVATATVLTIALRHNITLFIITFSAAVTCMILLSLLFPRVLQRPTCSIQSIYHILTVGLGNVLIINIFYYLLATTVISKVVFTVVVCLTILLSIVGFIAVSVLLKKKKPTLRLTMDDLQNNLISLEKELFKQKQVTEYWEYKRKSWKYDVRKSVTPMQIVVALYRLEKHTAIINFSPLFAQERNLWLDTVTQASDGIIGGKKRDWYYSGWYSARWYYFNHHYHLTTENSSTQAERNKFSTAEEQWSERVDGAQTLIVGFTNAVKRKRRVEQRDEV